MSEKNHQEKGYMDFSDIRSGQVNISQTGDSYVVGNVQTGGAKFVGRDAIVGWNDDSAKKVRGHLLDAIGHLKKARLEAEVREDFITLVQKMAPELTAAAEQEPEGAELVAQFVETLAKYMDDHTTWQEAIDRQKPGVEKTSELLRPACGQVWELMKIAGLPR